MSLQKLFVAVISVVFLHFIFASNVMAQRPVLISLQKTDVASGSGTSEDPVVSANGRFVAFESFAFNIIPDDDNGRKDVFYRDLQGVTTLVSVNLSGTGGGNGDSQNPAISADGRYVAFESRAGNLVANDSNNSLDVFVRDMQTGITTLVSINTFGTGSGNGESFRPTISANGQGITRTGNTSSALTMQYATSNGTATPGADYTATVGSVTFAAGETTKNVVIQLKNDTVDEFDETVLLTLSDFNATGQSSGSLSASILTLADDDAPPSISINDATVVEGSSGAPVRSFTLTLSAASGKPIAVNLTSSPVTATQVTDYSAINTLTTIPAGATSQSISFLVDGDTVFEDDETFTVTLSNPSNVTIDRGTATITIQNDDPLPGISVNDVALAEGNSGPRTFHFFIRLSNASSKPVSVQVSIADGSAKAGSDYFAFSGTLTFAPGSTVGIFPVPIITDTVVEPDETLFVNLTNPTGATILDSQAVGTIQNDDLAPVLLLEENSQRAAALELTSGLRDPFPLTRESNFGSDQHTRISLFALNLTLIAGENASAVTVSGEDDTGVVHSLAVEFVGVVPNQPTLSQIVVRLPDNVGTSTELKLKVTLRGQTSNVGVIRIASP
ncbi:MAG TPA: Calx-beta domain-containing protein [Pyrinomonadaceae bacterium]|nr:Calx-beta domain-containing protein [Pyrinomonadaceae bacterium]